MRTATITAEGKTDEDIILALEEAIRVIKTSGCTQGMDSNDSGEYEFHITGEEETEE